MTNIHKAYHYYYIVHPIEEFSGMNFSDLSCTSYVFDYKEHLPDYIQQGMVDVLTDHKGIVFTDFVLQHLGLNKVLSDFSSCFAFYLPAEICDERQSRYNKNYSFDFDLKELSKEVTSELLLQYERSAWKPILSIDPDLFFLKNRCNILIGGKDYKQIEKYRIYGVANKN